MLLILYRLIVNEGSYIETKILQSLLLEISQYEDVSDRSFKIIGQYPITPTKVGEVSDILMQRSFGTTTTTY